MLKSECEFCRSFSHLPRCPLARPKIAGVCVCCGKNLEKGERFWISGEILCENCCNNRLIEALPHWVSAFVEEHRAEYLSSWFWSDCLSDEKRIFILEKAYHAECSHKADRLRQDQENFCTESLAFLDFVKENLCFRKENF